LNALQPVVKIGFYLFEPFEKPFVIIAFVFAHAFPGVGFDKPVQPVFRSLQLAYQIAIHGRNDLALAPDPYTGFTMTLLRLHAFQPDSETSGAGGAAAGGGAQARARSAPAVRQEASAPAPVVAQKSVDASMPPSASAPAASPVLAAEPPFDLPYSTRNSAQSENAPLSVEEPRPNLTTQQRANAPAGERDWFGIVAAMKIGGLVRELAQQCELIAIENAQVRLRLPEAHKHLSGMQTARDKLQEALSAYLERPVRLAIEAGAVTSETPAQRNQVEKERRHAEAVVALETDPFVQEVIERFDATLIEASVKPLN
jgi:DNA polymerase-3 subunit gamma/tau